MADWLCFLSAVGEPGGELGGGGCGGAQRGPERPRGGQPQQRLPLPGPACAEPRPDEGQRHQRDHEHRTPLYQTPEGHL